MRFLGPTLRVVITLAMVVIAILAVSALWRTYMLAPWTRDGRVQAQVVNVAPEVSGTVVSVSINDNQLVKKGDPLFQIDKARFDLAVRQAAAALDSAQNQLKLARTESVRQQQLRAYASEEARQKADTAVQVAEATVASEQVMLDTARLNQARSTIVSPVNGYVTHLRLRPGSYVNAGVAQIAVVDVDSFWVDGYFEETKIGRINVGDQARIRLMGYDTPFPGVVESIGRGISDSNDAVNSRGLPTVSPIFTWVRLAQRIPIRIKIGELPAGIQLVVGMTASVAVGEEAEAGDGLGSRLVMWLRDRI